MSRKPVIADDSGLEIDALNGEPGVYSARYAGENATDEDKKDLAIVGVACPLNLISGGWKAATLGMPPQCVLLDKVACSRHWLKEDVPSSINKKELKKYWK